MATLVNQPLTGLTSLPTSAASRKKSYLLTMRDNATSSSKLVHPASETLQMILEREGEDAAITGGTRSLHRRLLALNLQAAHVAAHSRRPSQAEMPVSAKIA